MEASHTPFARPAFDQLPLTATSRYLDIGCGNGYTVRWAAAIATGGRAVGIDVSPAMIERAQQRSADHANVAFHTAEFPTALLADGSFDVIFSMEVFYYLPDLEGALDATHRLLKPGGTFACAVDFYGENVASHDWPADVGVPMRLMDAAGWRGALVQAGFVEVTQDRLRVPAEQASESWKATEGSLLTVGRRA